MKIKIERTAGQCRSHSMSNQCILSVKYLYLLVYIDFGSLVSESTYLQILKDLGVVGSITGNTATNSGGGIYSDKADSSSSFGILNIYGGSIIETLLTDTAGGYTPLTRRLHLTAQKLP